MVRALVGLVAMGCTYVTPAEFEAKRETLDEDGDGAPGGGGAPDEDCDDNEAKAFPGNTETAYDGIDNDCAEGDLVDQDADGFPGVLRADWEASFPAAIWSAGVVDSPIDCADDPVLRSEASNVYPGNTSDVAYDGIDANCLGDNDFDYDRDGAMPDAVDTPAGPLDIATAFATYQTSWNLALGAGNFGDCNDLDPDVSPDVAPGTDTPYDGIDHDCDGANDFDADGDGFMIGTGDPTDPTTAAVEAWVNTYRNGVPPTEDWGDCLDVPRDDVVDVLGLPFDAAQAHPGAADAPYDAVDGDCAADNDYDIDGDGWMPTEEAGKPDPYGFAAYQLAWGLSFPDQRGDCVDTDAAVFPVALEQLGDTVDQDCDGGHNTTPFINPGPSWETPRPPRVVDLSSAWVIVSATDTLDLGAEPVHDVGAAFVLPAEPLPGAPHLGAPVLWQGATNPQPLGGMIDVDPLANDVFTTAATYTFSSTTYLVVRDVTWDPALVSATLGVLDSTGTPTEYTATALDLTRAADGRSWATACGGNVLQVLAEAGDGPPAPAAYLSGAADLCFWDGVPDSIGTVVACNAAGCLSYTFDALTTRLDPVVDDPWVLQGKVIGATSKPGILAWFVGTGGAVVRTDGGQWDDLFDDLRVEAIDVAVVGPRLAIVAIGTDSDLNRRVVLRWGDPNDHMDTVDLPVPEELDATGIAVGADIGRIVVALSATDTGNVYNGVVDWLTVGW